MHEPRFMPHKDRWFIPPVLRIRQPHISRQLRNIDPVAIDCKVSVKPPQRGGVFAPSRKWIPYSELDSVSAGYLTPLYPLKAIRQRYGLTLNGERYFKAHILPAPFDIVRRRSVAAHHWSRFTLMALDVVMRDLEKRGLHYFSRSFHGHIEMVDVGTAFLADYYALKEDTKLPYSPDKFGVIWLED